MQSMGMTDHLGEHGYIGESTPFWGGVSILISCSTFQPTLQPCAVHINSTNTVVLVS